MSLIKCDRVNQMSYVTSMSRPTYFHHLKRPAMIGSLRSRRSLPGEGSAAISEAAASFSNTKK